MVVVVVVAAAAAATAVAAVVVVVVVAVVVAVVVVTSASASVSDCRWSRWGGSETVLSLSRCAHGVGGWEHRGVDEAKPTLRLGIESRPQWYWSAQLGRQRVLPLSRLLLRARDGV